jgi:uncharacterized BrkB/YihY/UPF0761 family membrane protein
MNSKLVFLTGWLGPTACVALIITTQMPLGLFVLSIGSPYTFFLEWAQAIGSAHFGLEGRERAVRWLTIGLLSAYYFFAFFAYALPDRVRWWWAVLILFSGSALGFIRVAKFLFEPW